MEPNTEDKKSILAAHIAGKVNEIWTLDSLAAANQKAGAEDEAKRFATLSATATRVKDCLELQLAGLE